MSVARRRLRTLEAAALLCANAFAIRVLPVRWLLPREPGKGPVSAPRQPALDVRGAIRSAAARLPFRASCLAQSLAAIAMLERRDAAYRFHIGARMTENFEAHAWVESGGLVVAGEGEVDTYSVLLTRQS